MYDYVDQVVNNFMKDMKDICGSQGADENEGDGRDSERTETDDVGDGPTEEATQATQEGVVESKQVGPKQVGPKQVEIRKNPPRNVKRGDSNLKKITKNTSCKEMTDFLTWYSDRRFVLRPYMSCFSIDYNILN